MLFLGAEVAMTPQELKVLIESDTEANQCWKDRRDAACANRCAAIAPTIRTPVAGGEIQKIASMNGVWPRIVLARESADTPTQIKGICITFLDWVEKGWQIDFDLPSVALMLGGLAQSGLISTEEIAELDAAATVRQTFTTDDVQQAMGA